MDLDIDDLLQVLASRALWKKMISSMRFKNSGLKC